MPIPKNGLTKEEIFTALEAARTQDPPWRTGRVLAFNYLPPGEAEEVMKTAYLSYLGENALDPTTIRSVHKLEVEVVRDVADLLRGGSEAVGNFTSGGTESILLMVKTMRDRARTLQPHIKEPEMILPRTAHGAFFKAAKYFDVKPVVVAFDETYRADLNAVKNAITPNTILLVGSAPAYAQGVIDPIEEMGQIALEHDLPLHVDGCVGGIQLSFMRQMGYDLPAFDFSVPGVTSISADLHKYGYAAKGASVILYKNKAYRRYQIFATAQSTTYAIINSTILSSRSGGPVAGAWAVLNYLGQSGYEKIYRSAMDATQRLMDGINATGDLHVLGKPHMCMFSFASDTLNVFQLADDMAKQGWYLQPQFSTELSPPNLHISVNLSTLPVVEAFLEELPKSVARVKASKVQLDFAVVRQQVQHLLANMPGDPSEKLSALAGLGSGTGLPSELALVNTVLDALPDELAEQLLVDFWNDLYV